MGREQRAIENFCSGLNCGQSVFMAFADLAGIDHDTAMRLSAPFGGGMGRMREVCGAVSASMMVLGLLFYDAHHPTNEEKSALYAREQLVAARFRAANGTIICRELLAGVPADDSPQAEERTAEYYRSRPCARLCGSAAKILEEYLAEQGVLPAAGTEEHDLHSDL